MTPRSFPSRTLAVLTGLGAVTVVGSASAAVLTVSDGSAPCPGATFSSVQAAVDAAQAGDTVDVCSGTYAEQVVIPAGKDALVLRSTAPLGAVLKAPAVMVDPGDIVHVAGAHDVTLEGLTIAGPLPDALFCSVLPRTGIRVDRGGSAVIRADRITEIRSADPALRGCQSGVAILVGHADEGQTGRALIDHTTIDAYQKTGVLVDNAGSGAIVSSCEIIGDGPSAVIAQNGIEIDRGAEALVTANHVRGQIYSPSPLASGILLYRPGRVLVLGNEVEGADFGISAVDALGPEILGNTVSACVGYGVGLDQETTGTSGAVVAGNRARDNGGDDLFVSAASKDNTLRRNVALANQTLDARDESSGAGTAGTANRWRDDRCKTDNRGGLLCAADDDHAAPKDRAR